MYAEKARGRSTVLFSGVFKAAIDRDDTTNERRRKNSTRLPVKAVERSWCFRCQNQVACFKRRTTVSKPQTRPAYCIPPTSLVLKIFIMFCSNFFSRSTQRKSATRARKNNNLGGRSQQVQLQTYTSSTTRTEAGSETPQDTDSKHHPTQQCHKTH